MRKLVSLAVSLLILGVIYWRIDTDALLAALAGSDAAWLAVSLAMVVPLTAVTAWRFLQLLPRGRGLGFGEAAGLILAASSLNMVLPSKLGDIAKAYFMRERGHLSGALSLAVVLFEKSCDMLALLFWCVFGLVIYPSKDLLFWLLTAAVAGGLVVGFLLIGSRTFARTVFARLARFAPGRLGSAIAGLTGPWGEMHAYFWRDRARVIRIFATSIGLWFLHLVQIWLFILALEAWAPLPATLALAPLALLVGLLPFTFAGIGTRDAALIVFFAPYLAAPTAAALGLLCTLRYFLPALGGVPFLGRYLGAVRAARPLS